MSKVTIFAMGAGLLLISAAAAAEMYRWVDSAGEVHYSDRPTQGSREVNVTVPGDAPPAPRPAAEEGSEQAEAGKPADAEAPADDNAQVRSQLCEQAKQRLASYQEADGLYEEDTAGGKRQLSVDERVETIVKAKRSVKELCETPPV
jgi:hypothetical protein